MFAIYNTEGLRFRDTLEKLRQIQPPLASNALQSHSKIVDDETQPKAKDKNRSKQAQDAYKDMLHLNQRELITHAHQLMSHPVRTISMEMDILDARQYFQQHKFQQMPVINAQQQLVGLLTLENLLQFIIIDGDRIQYLKGKRVADAMSEQVITADPVSDIRRVACLMLEYHLHGMPIVDQQDALLGIVSRSDILRGVTQNPPLTLWT